MPQPFSIEDLFLHQKVTELDAAPDGQSLACTVRSVDREQDDYVSCIWSVPLDGSTPRQLTRGPGQDRSPCWSPDGRQLAFVSNRAGSPQVHLLPRSGGEAAPLGRLPGAVSALRWMPDGKALVVTAAVSVDPDWRGARPDGRAPAQRKAQPQVAWKLPYKSDGIGYVLAREIHLFRLDAASGGHRQLTDGAFDVLACAVAPNGRHLAYARTREGRFAHRTDLWVADAEGRQARQLTRDFATVMSPAWSPDGRWIAFSATGPEGDAQTNLYLLEFASGRIRQVGDDELQVADLGAVHWSADGRSLLLPRQWRGRHQGVRVALEGGEPEELVGGDRQLGAFAPVGEALAFVVDHPSQPSEVHLRRADGAERPLSDFNPWWRERTPIVAETREFEVPDGRGGSEKIEGWQLRAEGVCDGRVAVAGKSYGGYLAAWAIGHTPLFRAAVVMAPIGDIETHYGTSDGGYYADPYYMGSDGRFDRALARRLSPLVHVEKATTPTLFMQGADDERCPRNQSEELFVTVMRSGSTPTELVLYPGEDHHFLGEGAPSVRQDAAERIVDWLARHVGRDPA